MVTQQTYFEASTEAFKRKKAIVGSRNFPLKYNFKTILIHPILEVLKYILAREKVNQLVLWVKLYRLLAEESVRIKVIAC